MKKIFYQHTAALLAIVGILYSTANYYSCEYSTYLFSQRSMWLIFFIIQTGTFGFLGHLIQRLYRQLHIDPLTGLGNNSDFRERVKEEICNRNNKPTSLILLSVINGRQYKESSAVMQRLAMVLSCQTQRADMVARLGDDCFGLILPQTNEDSVQQITRKIRSTLEKAHFPYFPYAVTINMQTITFWEKKDCVTVFEMINQCLSENGGQRPFV